MLRLLVGFVKLCVFSVAILTLGNIVEIRGRSLSAHVGEKIASRLKPPPLDIHHKMDEASEWAQKQADRLAREHEQMLRREREKLAKVIRGEPR